jgi:hypothetical protein
MVWGIPPLTDVYYYHTQAAGALVARLDPYGHLYTGIPAKLATPLAENVYAYLPGVLLFLTPFWALGDVRLGLIAADVVVALGLYWLRGRLSTPAAAAFLFAPWGFFFATSYPDSSLPAMAFLGLAFLWEVRGRKTLSAGALGASLASSQFVWLIFPFFFLLYVRRRDFRSVCVCLAVAAAFLLPFALWSPQPFVYDTITFQFSRPSQSIVSTGLSGYNINPTLSGVLYQAAGLSVPFLAKGVITFALLVLFLRRSRDMESMTINAAIFLTAAILVLPNDFFTCYLELPFQMGLTWLVLTRGGPPTNEVAPSMLKGRP